MNCCTNRTRAGRSSLRPASRAIRGALLAGGILPGVLFALLPKCPACAAAYVLLLTGVGVSASAMNILQGLLLGLSVFALLAALVVCGFAIQKFVVARTQN
jgi:hypothetical protein